MSRICMMYSRTPLLLVSFMFDNLVIRVLARALSEDSNCSSIAFSKLLTLLHSLIEPRILVEIFVFMNIILSRLDRSQCSQSAILSLLLVGVGTGGSSFLIA